MSNHVNICNDEVTIPYYAVHKDGLIAGFFANFRWLSNFYVLENGVFVGELCFPSVESAYQSCKWPENQRLQFTTCTPGQSKKLGRSAPGLDKKKWNKIKYDLMYELNWKKYTNNHILKQKLLLTDGYQLEERNSWNDLFWGTDEKGEGENSLGKILMKIRDVMIGQEKGKLW